VTVLTVDEDRNWLERILFSVISDGDDDDASGSVEEMIDEAARRAFRISTALGFIPGPLGMATILPEVAALTRLQANLIRRIARHHGKEHRVSKELMLLILANATGVTAGEMLLRKAGTTLVLKSMNTRAVRTMARKVGTRMVDMAAKKALGRWIPVITAPFFGYFSQSLTRKIGREAQRLFLRGMEIETAGRAS
jgi:histone H3/H4